MGKVEEEMDAVVAAASKAVDPTSPSLEKWDSVDIIGDLVDQENREIAKRQAELYTQRPVAQVTTKTPEELEQLSEDLWVAASQDRAAPAKILLDSGADPNALKRTGLMSTSTPLVVAACKGRTNVIMTLLQHKRTKVNMTVSGGWTALMWAAWYGLLEVVQQLVAAPGINMDQLNQAGKNAVMYAADQGRVEVCRLLLKGADSWEVEEEDRAVRKSRLDRLLDQALKANCDVPLAKMVLALRDMGASMKMTLL